MPRMRTSSSAELLLDLHRDRPLPLHSQLEQGLRGSIRSGRLAAGSIMPSTRSLAGQLGLSRGVVVEAYEQLVAEGYLTSQPGGATRVCTNATERGPERGSITQAPSYRIDFGYGRPDVSQFPRAAWLRSLRRVLNATPNDRLSYLDRRGSVELREALANYLNRVRGTAAAPDRMMVCNGFAQALDLVAQELAVTGRTSIAVEEPGQRDTIEAARRHGLQTVAIPVDGDGVVVDALVRTDADAIVVTPAHHFPTGAVLSPERRAALVAWAADGRRLVLEDDYDAEYRYDREPIGAIQGLAPEHVVYAGSASKTLAPGLRLGWIVAPSDLVDRLATRKEAIDRGSPSLEQLAFADFLERGEFDHHLRRMRPIYRGRRDALLRALHRHLPDLTPVGASAGLHVVAWLPPDLDEAAVVARSGAIGVRVDGVGRHHALASLARQGLLFGYGTPSEDEIDEGIRAVAGVVAALRSEAVSSREALKRDS